MLRYVLTNAAQGNYYFTTLCIVLYYIIVQCIMYLCVTCCQVIFYMPEMDVLFNFISFEIFIINQLVRRRERYKSNIFLVCQSVLDL